MSRFSKVFSIGVFVVFLLACNLVTQPIKDVQNVASTAKSVASNMPLETLQAITTSMPLSTLEALPSSLPAVETALPNIENMFNPQGQPVTDWNGIPIMSDATQGQEFSSTSYSFATPSDPKTIQDFYDSKLKDLGWSSLFGSQVSDQGGLLLFQKDKSLLTVTIAPGSNDNKELVVNFQLVSQ